MAVTWPDAPDGEWRGVVLAPPPGGARLDAVALTVEPPLAFRIYRVIRESDGEVLANGGWTPSRDRPLRIFPETEWVGPTDRVRFEVCTWHATAREGRLVWA